MSLSGTSVLVVEDHDFQRRTLVRILRNLGISDVAEAADGEEALQVLSAAPRAVDVVVCDLELPGMDGVALLGHLADNAPGQAVIIASGMEQAVLDGAEAAGTARGLLVLGRIAKPITAAGLLDALHRLPAAPRTAPVVASQAAGPVLELRADSVGGPATGVRVSGDVDDEDLIAAACRLHRRLLREGHDLRVAVVLPDRISDPRTPVRLAGRAALEGVAPRHLTVLLDGDAAEEVIRSFSARGFAVQDGDPPATVSLAGGVVTSVDELLATLADR